MPGSLRSLTILLSCPWFLRRDSQRPLALDEDSVRLRTGSIPLLHQEVHNGRLELQETHTVRDLGLVVHARQMDTERAYRVARDTS